MMFAIVLKEPVSNYPEGNTLEENAEDQLKG